MSRDLRRRVDGVATSTASLWSREDAIDATASSSFPRRVADRVGDDEVARVRAGLRARLGEGRDDGRVRVEEVVARHARLARNARRNDHHLHRKRTAHTHTRQASDQSRDEKKLWQRRARPGQINPERWPDKIAA